MNNQIDTESTFVSVDLEQWHRDIDTFTAATTSALDAIICELSTVCSGGKVSPVVSKSIPTQATPKPALSSQQLKKDSGTVRATAALLSSNEKSDSPANSGSRLASLKEKLASRINKV